MTYTPAYYQNRDKDRVLSSHLGSKGKRVRESSQSLSAPQGVQPVSYLAEKSHASQDSFQHSLHPHSPVSTASYSRNTSFADPAPVQIPSPTYSQSSRTEQGYCGRDVNSRSGIMIDEYGHTSMPPATANSPNYIFTGHEDAESVDEASSNHAVWLLVWYTRCNSRQG